MKELSNAAVTQESGGLEWMEGIPGTWAADYE